MFSSNPPDSPIIAHDLVLFLPFSNRLDVRTLKLVHIMSIRLKLDCPLLLIRIHLKSASQIYNQ